MHGFDGGRPRLVVSPDSDPGLFGDGAGLAGVDITEALMLKSNKSKSAKSKSTTAPVRRAPALGSSKTPTMKTTSKRDQILNLLRRKQGASLVEMQKASGWQAHSVRGFLAGTVKKRLGLKLTSDKSNDGERQYFVAQS